MLNEPYVSDRTLAGNPYKTFNEQIISAIESVETHSHLKIVELLNDAGWMEILDYALDLNKQNVLWATHNYAPMYDWNPDGSYYVDSAFTWNGQYYPAGWSNATIYTAWRIIVRAEKIHSWNKPWINTEFSKVTTQTGWQIWYNTVLSVFAQYNITGWTFHCYSSAPSKEGGWNINDPATQQAIMNVIRPFMVQP
jgi:hypothetical protein